MQTESQEIVRLLGIFDYFLKLVENVPVEEAEHCYGRCVMRLQEWKPARISSSRIASR